MKTLFSTCLATLALGLSAGAAHAGGVNWSIGINLPPVATVISNGPAYYPPPPVYYEPRVVYRPAPVYYEPPVVYRPVPRYYAPPVVVYRGGWDHGHRGYDGPRGRGWDRGWDRGEGRGEWRGERRYHH